jgi:hypothetical protein
MSLEENKKVAEQKIKEKQAAKKAKEAAGKQEAAVTPAKKENPAEVHKGTVVQLPPKETAGMCIVRDAFLEEEDVLIETVTGEQSISKKYGDTIFGKTRKLLHCTISVQEAKCFAIPRERRFYDPVDVPEEQPHEKNILINAMHVRFSHASAGELKRILKTKLKEFEMIQPADVDHWWQENGRFCSGCVEGKMKEHAKIKSSKPLSAEKPGNVTVGDIMFVEGARNVKKPLLIHVDVCSKMITGMPLKDKSEEVCTCAIMQIKAVYARNNHELRQLVFDREPGIVPIEDVLSERGTELKLKAAGQKVGLAEVSIRLIREKARATKAGVRAKFGYLPPNQFNMDLCLDCIAVLNRIPKQDVNKTPYETFTNGQLDYMRDFRVEWGEPIVVKKKKRHFI